MHSVPFRFTLSGAPMATPEEMRQLMQLGAGDEPGDKALRAYMIEQLADREADVGATVRCQWCGKGYRKDRRSQKFCQPECRAEFHVFAKRYIRTRRAL
jgi:hypothetical protein